MKSSTFFNFRNVYRGKFPKFKSGTLKKFPEEELVNVENGKWKVESGKWKCPHILHVKPTIRGFILPLDSFSNLLPSSFWKVIWSYLSILPITLDVHERRKQHKRNHLRKLSWALKLTAEKFMSKYWKRNPRLHASLLFLFLPCSTVYNQGILSHAPNMIKWHNSE